MEIISGILTLWTLYQSHPRFIYYTQLLIVDRCDKYEVIYINYGANPS